MRSEERRALVLLGITAVLAAFLATMYGLIWIGPKKLEDFFFNVPCNAVPHLTVYDIPLLQGFVGAWIAYAFFAFFYFSDDWFQGRRGSRFRNLCHGLAAFSMGFYFLYAVWFIAVLYVALVWIPPQFGQIYAVTVLLGLLYLQIRFIEMATYNRGLYGRLFRRFWGLTGGPILTAFEFQLTQHMTRLWNKHSGKLPEKLRDRLVSLRNRLVSLRRFIHSIRQNRRVRGRINLFTVFLGLVAILFVVGYLLYGTYCGFPFHLGT